MRTFSSKFWLAVPKDEAANRKLAGHCGRLSGDRAEESVRCYDGSRTVVHSGWRLEDFRSEVKPVLRSFTAAELSIYRCAPGETHGIPWRRNILRALPRRARYARPPRRRAHAHA